MLTLATHNRAVAQPFRTGRERQARRAQLGLVCHEGGLPPRREQLSVSEQYRLAAERRAKSQPADDYVDPPCDV